MSDKTYNGWTNYEAWNVKLWLDSDEGACVYWSEAASEALEQRHMDSDDAASQLACRLKDEMEEAMPDLGASW